MASTEAPISITVKSAAGSLVTVRAEHGDELDQFVASALDAIKSAVTELEAAVRGVQPVIMAPAQIAATLGASIIDTTPSQDGGWSAQAAPAIGGKNCPHGRMTAIQGTGKDGNLYRGYFCPAQKGAFDKCRNVYVKMGNTEWNTFVADQVK